MQRGTSATFEGKFSPKGEENKLAKPANLQADHDTHSETEEDPALAIQQRVRTPRGNGIVVQRWPDLVGVKLDETQEIAYFRGEDEIALVQSEHREIAEPAAPNASPPGQSHLERLRGAARVSTPKGNGRLWYNEPLRVGVNLDGTHHCTWFRDPDDLARILPEPKPQKPQEELP